MNLQESIRNDLKLFEAGEKAGTIINNDEPGNPDVRVSGFGDMKLHQLEASVQDKLVNLVERGNEGNYSVANWAINEQGTLGHLLKAIADINAEMELDEDVSSNLHEAKVEGQVVKVGDVVWFKDDYETAGEITKINGNALTLEVEGEGGVPWDTETRVVNASECWIG